MYSAPYVSLVYRFTLGRVSLLIASSWFPFFIVVRFSANLWSPTASTRNYVSFYCLYVSYGACTCRGISLFQRLGGVFSFIAGPYARLESSRVELVVVFRNVYGTFNFIWIITICFRRLAEKFSTSVRRFSHTLLLSLSPSLSLSRPSLGSHAPFASPLPGTMSREVGVGRGYWANAGVQGTFPYAALDRAPPVAAPNVIANFRQMWILNLQVQLLL